MAHGKAARLRRSADMLRNVVAALALVAAPQEERSKASLDVVGARVES